MTVPIKQKYKSHNMIIRGKRLLTQQSLSFSWTDSMIN